MSKSLWESLVYYRFKAAVNEKVQELELMSSVSFGQSVPVSRNTSTGTISLSLAMITAMGLREGTQLARCDPSTMPRALAKFGSRGDSLFYSHPIPAMPAAAHPPRPQTLWDKNRRRERQVLTLQKTLQCSEKEGGIKSPQKRAKELSLGSNSSFYCH